VTCGRRRGAALEKKTAADPFARPTARSVSPPLPLRVRPPRASVPARIEKQHARTASGLRGGLQSEPPVRPDAPASALPRGHGYMRADRRRRWARRCGGRGFPVGRGVAPQLWPAHPWRPSQNITIRASKGMTCPDLGEIGFGRRRGFSPVVFPAPLLLV